MNSRIQAESVNNSLRNCPISEMAIPVPNAVLFPSSFLSHRGSHPFLTASPAPHSEATQQLAQFILNPDYRRIPSMVHTDIVKYLSTGREDLAIGHLHRFGKILDENLVNDLMKQSFNLNKQTFFKQLFLSEYNLKPNINTLFDEGPQSQFQILFKACLLGLLDWMKLIFEICPDVHLTDAKGNTPLHFYCMQNQPEVIALLLEKGLCIDTLNQEGSSPLHAAVKWGSVDMTHSLLVSGANPHLPNQDTRTALSEAMNGWKNWHKDRAVYEKIANELIAFGANIRELQEWFEDESSNFERVLSNANGVPSNIFMTYEGLFYDYPLYKLVSSSLAEMPMETYPFSRETLQEPLLFTHALFEEDQGKREEMFTEVLSKIYHGELVFLKIGVADHAVFLVFFDKYIGICNRGPRPPNCNTIDLFEIDRSKMSRSILEKLESLDRENLNYGIGYVHDELPIRQLRGTKKAVLGEVEVLLQNKKQKVGNCSFNIKGALRVAAYFLSKQNGFSIDQSIKTAIRFSKRWSTYFRTILLNSYLHDEQRQLHKEKYEARSLHQALPPRDEYLTNATREKLDKRQRNPKAKIEPTTNLLKF